MNVHTKGADAVQIAETCTDPTAHEPHEVFYVQFAPSGFCEEGETIRIRKWSRTPFEGGRMCRVALDLTPAKLNDGGDVEQVSA